MAEEEKKPKQRWTADELLVLLTYVQELGPNDKVSYTEVVDLLADEGYERTDKQVQKKFERLRYESKAQNIDIETRLQDLITAMYGDDDEPVEQVKSPKATTPKSKQDEIVTRKGIRKRWNVREHKVLLECLIAGQDKASEIADKFPDKDLGKVYHKLNNVQRKAREKNIGVVEVVQQQIKRLQGEVEDDKEESSEEEKTPAKKGTKRKLEENAPEDRSVKKQRVFESPKPTATHTNHNGVAPDNAEIKKLLNQMASNSRENFNNLRKYIDGKFEEKRLQDAEQTAEIKKRMKSMENNMDLMLREIRSLKSIVTKNTPSKSHVSAPISHTSNKEFNSNNNGTQSVDSSPSKQISYFNFL